LEAAKNGTLIPYSGLINAESVSDDDSNDRFSREDTEAESEIDFDGRREIRPGSFTSPVSETDADLPSGTDSPFAKLFGSKKKKTNSSSAPRTNEKTPKGTGRRVSASSSIEDAWTAIGGFAARSPKYAPLGRFLQWQSPAAGQMMDEALAGSVVDRKLLQPGIKARGRLDTVGAIVGPPLLIMAITQNPDRAPILIPALKSSIRASLPTMLPAMKKAQAKEDKINAAVREFFPDIPEGVDPVDIVIAQLFEGFMAETPPNVAPEESEVNNAAQPY